MSFLKGLGGLAKDLGKSAMETGKFANSVKSMSDSELKRIVSDWSTDSLKKDIARAELNRRGVDV